MKIHAERLGAMFVLVTLLAACSQQSSSPSPSTAAPKQASAQQQFFDAIASRCGEAFEGKLVSTDAADADMANQSMVMHLSTCSANEIRIPFHVGENRSRTWVLTRTGQGLRLKHDHRHADGSGDAITQYGGDTVSEGSATRQEFPVDAESITLFSANNMQVSTTNIWAVEMDASKFAYELRREGRWFRVEFDLTHPVVTPPAAWGA
ncbi:MAG: hypothetical protein ABI127_06325 [Dokdonella sp.]